MLIHFWLSFCSPYAAGFSPQPIGNKRLLYMESYIELPKEYWQYISSGDRIRYTDIDGADHSGGIITKNPATLSDDYYTFRVGYNPVKYFNVRKSNIEKIFIEVNATNRFIIDSIKTIIKRLDKLEKHK